MRRVHAQELHLPRLAVLGVQLAQRLDLLFAGLFVQAPEVEEQYDAVALLQRDGLATPRFHAHTRSGLPDHLQPCLPRAERLFAGCRLLFQLSQRALGESRVAGRDGDLPLRVQCRARSGDSRCSFVSHSAAPAASPTARSACRATSSNQPRCSASSLSGAKLQVLSFPSACRPSATETTSLGRANFSCHCLSSVIVCVF